MRFVNNLVNNVIFEEAISCKLIINAYKRDYDINVSEYFAGINSVKIYKCLDTGYRFFFPFSLAGLSQLYEELQKQQGYYGIRQEHQIAEAFFKADESVIEIGCGSGAFLEKLQQKSIICAGLELNEEAVRGVKNKCLNILKEDISQHSQANFFKYDVVYCFQVHFKSKSKLLGGFMENLLLDMKPTRLRWELQKAIGRCVQGRNILAVYTKT